MASSLSQYATGVGIPLGAGVGATTTLLAGVQSEFAVVVGFGAIGGLVVGGFVGQFAESPRARGNWALSVFAFALVVSLLAGGLLGGLTAWMVDGPLTEGFVVGSAAGGVFSLLLGASLVSSGRQPPPTESNVASE